MFLVKLKFELENSEKFY